jgi:hypothetical protein
VLEFINRSLEALALYGLAKEFTMDYMNKLSNLYFTSCSHVSGMIDE